MIKGLIAAVAALAAMPAQAADIDPDSFGVYTNSITREGAAGTWAGTWWWMTFNFNRLPAVDRAADFTINDATASLGGSLSAGNPITLEYNAALDRLTMFGANGGQNVVNTTNDFFATIDNVFRGTPTAGEITFSLASAPGGVWRSNYSLAVVPEPAAWAMMISGFGLAGAAVRRRRVNLAFA